VQGWIIAAVALLVGLLTIYSMTKIWAEAFWKAHPDGRDPTLAQLDPGVRRRLLLPVGALAALTLVIGFYPEPFVTFAKDAAAQLLDPTAYVVAVLGDPS
jgi:multicomponent Na+:H+ antiporter subunit D